jgi:hypothetical protein
VVTKRFYTIVLLTSLIGLVAPLSAQQSWSSPEEFRGEYMRLLDTLSQRVPSSDDSAWAVDVRKKISDIRQQVNGLSYPAMDQFGKLTDRQSFKRMVDGLNSGKSTLQPPPGGNRRAYAAATSRIQPLGVIVPPDDSGAVAGTTCSTSPTDAGTLDGEKIGLYVDRGLGVPLDYACETIVEILGEGTNAPFCIAAAIAKAVEVVLDSLIDHQEFCNGLLDGSKADAILGDIINVHGDVGALDTHLTNVNDQITSEFSALDTHITNVDNHIAAEFVALDAHLVTLVNQLSNQIAQGTALLAADLKQVMKLELTPEGLRKIVPAILTCTGSNCPNVLANCPGTGCAWNLVGPLP